MANIKSIASWMAFNLERILFVIFWMLYLALVLFARGGYWETMPTAAVVLTFASLPAIFYINSGWLIPSILRNGFVLRYGIYVLGIYFCMLALRLFLLWMGGTTVKNLLECLNPFAVFGNDLFVVFLIGFILSFVYRLIKDLILNNRLIEKLESEKTQMQLAYLKSQVDPHFLFNTLNSIYATALEEQSSKTAEGITKLSTLMRYNLHDTQEPFISLAKELNYIEKYIELQEMRATPDTNIKLSIDIVQDESELINIAPMVLIPFIENAFKHGVSPTEKSDIEVKIALEDGILRLNASNTIITKHKDSTKSGVGLRNAKQRLNLLYPEKHLLKINKKNKEYSVILQINLS